MRGLFRRAALSEAANIHFQLLIAAQAGLDEVTAKESDIKAKHDAVGEGEEGLIAGLGGL